MNAFSKELGLDNEELLEEHVEVVEVSAGSCLMKQDSTKDTALVYLLSGNLVMSQRPSDSTEDMPLLFIQPGEVIGGLAVLTGEASFFTIRARHFSKVALINRYSFYE